MTAIRMMLCSEGGNGKEENDRSKDRGAFHLSSS